MSFYSNAASTANKLLVKFGQPVTLTQITEGAYDPNTGTVVSAGTTYVGSGALFDYAQREIDGTLVQQTDRKLYLSAKQINGQAMPVPQTQDTVTVGSAVYSVVRSMPLNPAGTDVLFEAQVRL